MKVWEQLKEWGPNRWAKKKTGRVAKYLKGKEITRKIVKRLKH